MKDPLFSWDIEDESQHSFYAADCENGLSWAALSGAGGREENQDAWGVTAASDGSLIFAVADGLGGHRGGRVAAHAAIAGALEAASSPEFDFWKDTALQGLLDGAQQAILAAKEGRRELSSMRSTLVILALRDGLANWIHVGDVRLTQLRSQRLLFQTLDHSVPQMLVSMGEIKPEEIRSHPDRSRILKALGKAEENLRPGICRTFTQLASEDCFYLSTDGFWEWILEEELEAALEQGLSPEEALLHFEKTLRRRAGEKEPEYDNYTALCIRLGQVSRNEAFWHRTRFVKI